LAPLAGLGLMMVVDDETYTLGVTFSFPNPIPHPFRMDSPPSHTS